MQEKEKKSLLFRLKEFLNFFEIKIESRGREIYRQKKIHDVKFDPENRNISAKVKASSSHLSYEVVINTKNLFHSECTCPYEWGLCKHIAATTLYLITELSSRPNQALLIDQANTVVSIPLLNKKWLKDNTPDAIAEEVDILLKNAEFETENPKSGVLDINIKVGGNTLPVTFKARKGSYDVTTSCKCRENRFILCKHKLAALHVLKQRYKTTVFDTCLDWSKEEKQLTGQLGATPEMVKQKKVPLEFVFRERQLEIDSKSTKLVKNSLFQLIPEPGGRIHSEPVIAKQHHQGELIYVLSLSYLDSGIASFKVHLFKGFYTKDGSRIKSTGFTEIFDPLSDDLFLQKATESDYKILQKSKMLSGLFNRLMRLPHDEMPEYDMLTNIYSVLQPLFRLLSDRMLYLYYDMIGYYYNIRLNQCYPVQMSNDTINPVITQKPAKDYTTLYIDYYINGQKVKPEPKEGLHYWFFRKENTLHPWQNSAALFLYEISGHEALDRIDFLDFQREKLFDRFIRFFQDKIEVVIEEPDIKPLEEADSEKRVYLQEHGEHILFFPVMLYGHSEVNLLHGTSDGLLYERRESDTVQIKRDKEAEEEALQAIRETLPQFQYQQEHEYFFLTIKQMLDNNCFIKFYEKCRANHIRVFGFKELKSIKYHPAGASVSYSIKSNEDWFDMELSVSFDDHQVSLKDLRKAVVNHENLVPIGDGQYCILPDEFLKKFSSALKVGEIEEESVRLQKSQFTVVHALLNQQSDARIVEELSEKMQMLKSFDKIESVPVPQNLKATMRDYQKAGLSWLALLARFSFGGCLADDMGLGKTLQMLAFFLHLKEKDGRKNHTHLVVCPTTLIFNWQNEIKKFVPSLKTLVYWGTQRQFDEKEMKKHDVVLTSYGTMVNDIESLYKFRFTTVVFDESQAMKNPSSLRFKAALLLQAQYRFSLTGTPIENNTIELFSQMHVLNRGLLGTFSTFRKTYGKNLEGEENAHLRQELRR
ncbi:MAG: SNF2-related protein, partial [Bacteroidota bacterium]